MRTSVAELGLGQTLEKNTFLFADPRIEEARNGTKFVKAELRDLTGCIGAKRFDVSNTAILDYAGQVLEVDGFVEEYNGSPVFRLEAARPAKEYDVADFVRRSDFSRVELEAALTDFLIEVNSDIGRVLEEVFSDPELWERFLTVPAAERNHHAWDGGLAEHVLSMLQLAAPICRHYQDRYGSDYVSFDLLMAGVFLHDLGKAYDFDRAGLTWVPSRRRVLVGHIATCTEILARAYDSCGTPELVREKLTHLVLSHHGQTSWGSPVEPATIEATILHQVDMIDSHVAPIVEEVRELGVGEVSNYSRILRGRVVR